MRKILSILFISLYIIGGTELGQLLKLPLLVQHYMKHKVCDDSITFLDFLDEHYGHGNVMDGDYEEDMKLPFKKTESDFTQVQHVNLCSSELRMPGVVEMYFEKPVMVFHCYLPLMYLDAIWQPPRTV